MRISFPAPPVNPGVIMQARLTVALAEAGRPDGASTFEKDFWIFPAEPFENRQEWLRDLDITLFDPDQKTAAVLEEHKLPFTLTQNLDALAAKQQGLIVVGEGVSYRDYPALAAILMRRASVGVPVLMLAPAPRSFFETALGEGDSPRPRQVTLGGPEMIRQIDKRLDAAGWAPEGRIVASSLKLSGERSRIVADVVEGDRDWSWLEIRYSEDRPQALFCGLAIVEQWPPLARPRYLLLALLERLTGPRGTLKRRFKSFLSSRPSFGDKACFGFP